MYEGADGGDCLRLSVCQCVIGGYVAGVKALFTHERVPSFVSWPNTTSQICGEGWKMTEEGGDGP